MKRNLCDHIISQNRDVRLTVVRRWQQLTENLMNPEFEKIKLKSRQSIVERLSTLEFNFFKLGAHQVFSQLPPAALNSGLSSEYTVLNNLNKMSLCSNFKVRILYLNPFTKLITLI